MSDSRNSQDVELQCLYDEAFAESFHSKLGGRVDVIEHDAWKKEAEVMIA